jgi:outer membrane lipoprotein carrier protein
MRHAKLFRVAATGVAALAMVWTSAVAAAGLDQLRAFISGAKSGKASFVQAVQAKGRSGVKESSGTFMFERPGKFRWTYQKPFDQLIVGDGEKLWIFDRDLNQVIVRKLDQALGASPAALLAGDNALERNFDLSNAGGNDGLEMIEAKPKSAEATTFTRVRIAFRNNLPEVMELTDTFGNVTTLFFRGFERNPKLDADQFRFVPPKGADVVGE